jgi:FkbM family methyltransferase
MSVFPSEDGKRVIRPHLASLRAEIRRHWPRVKRRVRRVIGLQEKKSDTDSILIYGHRYTLADLNIALFIGYQSEDVPLLSKLADADAKSEVGFITDRYGIRTRTANLWLEMKPHDGALTGLPIPGNFHWETIEWLALIKSVLSAGNKFRLLELGAGWGPATVGSAVLARLRGISDIYVVAVEADPHHIRFLRQHLEDNQVKPEQFQIYEAAVGVENGIAEWPDVPGTAVEYGNRPLTGDGDYLGRKIARTRKVPIVAIKDLLNTQPEWDLLHVDIQGTEVEMFRAALDLCDERVARVCIGTHSRKIDGDLFEMFATRGWIMEHEKPTKMNFVRGAKTLEAMNSVDGTQVWRNPLRRPEDVTP